MSTLSYAANAYWKAAINVRSGKPAAEHIEDLVLILSNLDFPDSLCRGAADAMTVALDRGAEPVLTAKQKRDLKYALDARDEMEEERWSDFPAMHEGEPEVRYLPIRQEARNG